jgi:type VI secretion system protein ImpF
MANISLRERLQPALLDRLHDDERALHVIDLTMDSAAMARLQVAERDLVTALLAAGLRQQGPGGDAGAAASASQLVFTAPAGSFPVARLKALPVARPAGPKALLGDVCAINVRTVTSTAIESVERRMISMRRLRESVLRDLEWLFNTSSLEATDDLDAYPEMQRSVLNYGLPPMTGRLATAIDPLQAAADIALAIRNFEPRLSHVRVVPEVDQSRMDSRTISFRIEAELWGQPTSQQLLLRTQLDVHSRDLKVTESASG